MSARVLIIGGGIIGCAVAWELAAAGHTVTILERDRPGRRASWAALGILQPHLHPPRYEPRAFLEIGQASFSMYPDWLERVQRAAGVTVEWAQTGAVEVAYHAAAAGALRERAALEQEAGVAVEPVDSSRLRDLEPLLAGDVVAGLWYPQAAHVDNRRLSWAVAVAAQAAGARLIHGVEATELEYQEGNVVGVWAGDTFYQADVVIVASGAWASRFLPDHVEPVKPVKGQALALNRPAAAPRLMVSDGEVWVLARGDRLVVGATVEEVGFDTAPTVQGVADLLTRAMRLVPSLATAPLAEVWADVRPATADGLPRIGWAAEGLVVAVGHYRAGILLAPVTAAAVRALVEGKPPPVDLSAFAPGTG